LNRANTLKNSLTALFRSGADQEHTAEEMTELLEGIDFPALLQAVYSMRETVYEYRVDGEMEKSFAYRGPELFPGKAVLLYTDAGYGCYDVALHERAYELWLLPDATFVVVSRIRTVIGSDASVMEYRTIKGVNWKDAGMTIDFLDLADDLEAICTAVTEHELPLYEL
jgi:hypothetical protein